MKPLFAPPIWIAVVVLVGIWTTASQAAVSYIGDGAAEGQDVTAGTEGPDGANGGNITYAFSADTFENDTGAPLSLRLEEVNFWANNPGTLTPFVAIYNGLGYGDGANFEILAVGDPIDGTMGANNAEFTVDGVKPTVSLGDGEELAAGFHQTAGMVPWADGTPDYLKENDIIPAIGGNLPGNTSWTDLARVYRFNVGVEAEVDDTDSDGMPDAFEDLYDELDSSNPDDADDDIDGDTLTNLEEFEAGTNPTEEDTDGDTLRDDAELAGAGNRPPTNPSDADTDGDGLGDAEETNTGTYVSPTDTGSNPTLADSDGDTLIDGDEVQGANPGNFFSDPNLADTDGDGFGDAKEIASGHDPNDGSDFPVAIFIGDVPDQGAGLIDATIGPDTAGVPGGNLTYAFFSDPYLNGSGGAQSFLVTGVNFEATTLGSLTPFVALYDPADRTLGDSYSVITVGDPIDSEVGVNNAQFTVDGENPVISIEDGEQVVGGFHQSVGMVPWNEPGNADPDYITNAGGAGSGIPDPSGLPAPLATNSNWDTLGREYAFNIALEPGSGPAPLQIDIQVSGSDLIITWESQGGRLYNLRSETGLTTEPITWSIVGTNENIEATPPENSLTIPRPADPTRFYVIEEFPAPPEVIFTDDLESGQGSWTVGTGPDHAPGTMWELGSPSGAGPATANSPDNAFGTNIGSEYAFDANVWLRSPPIDLSAAADATLRYFEWRDIETMFDSGRLVVLDAADDSEIAEIDDTIEGVSNGWEEVSRSIPAAALGKTIKIEWRFFSDDFSNFAGWYLDDISVTVP